MSQPVSDFPVITNVTDITDEPDVAMGNNSFVLDPTIVRIQAASSVSSPPNEAFIFSSFMRHYQFPPFLIYQERFVSY